MWERCPASLNGGHFLLCHYLNWDLSVDSILESGGLLCTPRLLRHKDQLCRRELVSTTLRKSH